MCLCLVLPEWIDSKSGSGGWMGRPRVWEPGWLIATFSVMLSPTW